MADANAERDTSVVTLYRLHGCPYCERVVRRLEAYDVPYRSRFVGGEHSRRDVVRRVTGTRSVPAIVDPATGVTMVESGRIVEYLERTYGDGSASADPAASADEVA